MQIKIGPHNNFQVKEISCWVCVWGLLSILVMWEDLRDTTSKCKECNFHTRRGSLKVNIHAWLGDKRVERYLKSDTKPKVAWQTFNLCWKLLYIQSNISKTLKNASRNALRYEYIWHLLSQNVLHQKPSGNAEKSPKIQNLEHSKKSELWQLYSFQVRWYKNSMLLEETNTVRMESRSNRHTLVLSSIRSGLDFGNYSCVAENSLGTFK